MSVVLVEYATVQLPHKQTIISMMINIEWLWCLQKHFDLEHDEPHTFREIPQYALFATHMTSQNHRHTHENPQSLFYDTN